MKINKRLFILLFFSIVTACDSNETIVDPPSDQKVETILHVIDSDNGKPVSKLEYGKPVRFVLELINSTDSAVSFRFPNSQQYDFEVRGASNQLLWNWSHDKIFTQAETSISLDAGGKVKFTPLWDQKDNKGNQLAPGEYSVTGMIATPGPDVQKQTFTIEKPVSTDVGIEQLLAAPELVAVGKNILILEADLWRDFMPISPPDGKPLIALIKIIEKNQLAIPEGLVAERLWVVNGKEVWATEFSDETRPGEARDILEKIARNGPKWGPGIKVDVIVGFQVEGGKLLLLKAAKQLIKRTS